MCIKFARREEGIHKAKACHSKERQNPQEWVPKKSLKYVDREKMQSSHTLFFPLDIDMFFAWIELM